MREGTRVGDERERANSHEKKTLGSLLPRFLLCASFRELSAPLLDITAV